jgi:hypothetical protein
MKLSVKKLSLVLAVLLSVAIAPAAWSATFTLIDEPIIGAVYKCETGTSGIQIETDAGIVSIFGMGPASYWGDVPFPEVGETIQIWVFEVTYIEGDPKLVAQSIDVNNDGAVDIILRDADGVPLWRGSKASLTQTKGNR